MAYTPIPFGTPNWDVPVNAAFTDQDARITALENQPDTAIKIVDESVVNSTAYQDDNDLLLPAEAGVTYLVEGFLAYTTEVAAGINLRLTGPAGVGRWVFDGLSGVGQSGNTGTVRMDLRENGVGSARLGGAGASPLVATIRGILMPTANGNLQLAWAQNAVNATPTIMLAQSWLSLRRVA